LPRTALIPGAYVEDHQHIDGGVVMRRTLAILAVAGLVIGGGAAAFAATTGGDGATGDRAQAKACIQQARDAHKDDKAARREAVKACLQQAGVDLGRLGGVPKGVRDQVKALTPEQRTALKDCVRQAHEAHEGDKPAFRDAAKACLAQAGITLPAPTPEQQARRQKLEDCRKQVRTDHPDASRQDLRDLVKQCVGAK
jgi:Spy/CpxP family protein refolding chaperone